MLRTSFTLISKRELTHDVYELSYSCSDMSKELPKPGQYAMFQLVPGLSRAYSIAFFSDIGFTLIIKRIADGRWSPMICDADVDTVFTGMIPLGHFTLRDTTNNKCFIGTGTGFAPLYCQMLACAQPPWEGGIKGGFALCPKIAFIFWVRENVDTFYRDEITSLGEKFLDFTYVPYLSRWDLPWYEKRYVTDWITSENIALYQEFYICGSPSMVESARNKLGALGITKEQIFWEQY